MIGAIIGDIVGSIYEFNSIKNKNFPLFSQNSDFTDDTVLTIATADCILQGGDYAKMYQSWGLKFQGRGYGGRFTDWLETEKPMPYNSNGNGSAMRVSPVGFAYNNLAEVMEYAKASSMATHNHSEGIKGAQAVAVAIFMARQGASKHEIKKHLTKTFAYNLDRKLDEIRPVYTFDESCPGSVPEAIIAFLESEDFEDAIRNAVSLGGDSDTQACIAGAIAQAFYKNIPGHMIDVAMKILSPDMVAVVDAFNKKFNVAY